MMQNVKEKIDATRRPAADKLEYVASALHDKARNLPGGERVSSLAHRTADTMHTTAQYVRGHDMREMMYDAGMCVRKYPARSLLAAGAVGFLLGRVLQNRD
jgi:ElaB/YqjD/DUF883 family membrane-anchored ribosome-binding protein